MLQKINLLAFAAHPDDVEISASGILIKHKESGLSTGIIDLTAGELGSRGSAVIRKAESDASSSILNLDIRENLGLADGFFEITEASLMLVVQVLRKYQPDIVLINAEKDRHPDHGRAHELIKRACFLSGLVKIKTTDEGDGQAIWRPKNIYSYMQDYFFEPDIIVDVSAQWEKRMASLMAYQSQFYNPDSKEIETPISGQEFLDNLVGRSYQLGRHIGCKHAEGLIRIRPTGTNLLTDIY